MDPWNSAYFEQLLSGSATIVLRGSCAHVLKVKEQKPDVDSNHTMTIDCNAVKNLYEIIEHVLAPRLPSESALLASPSPLRRQPP